MSKFREGSVKDWSNIWEINDTGFHLTSANPVLAKYEKVFFSNHSRVFVPLCGKTVDLIYLADKGHEVYGCEFLEGPVKEFFRENDLDFTVSDDVEGIGPVYKAKSKKIIIYLGDFFALKSHTIGKFDAIWDRAAMTAVLPSKRADYVESIKNLITSHGKFLLNTLEIKGAEYRGPPFSMPFEVVEKLFSASFEVKMLDCKSLPVPNDLHNADAWKHINCLLSLKLPLS